MGRVAGDGLFYATGVARQGHMLEDCSDMAEDEAPSSLEPPGTVRLLEVSQHLPPVPRVRKSLYGNQLSECGLAITVNLTLARRFGVFYQNQLI